MSVMPSYSKYSSSSATLSTVFEVAGTLLTVLAGMQSNMDDHHHLHNDVPVLPPQHGGKMDRPPPLIGCDIHVCRASGRRDQ